MPAPTSAIISCKSLDTFFSNLANKQTNWAREFPAWVSFLWIKWSEITEKFILFFPVAQQRHLCFMYLLKISHHLIFCQSFFWLHGQIKKLLSMAPPVYFALQLLSLPYNAAAWKAPWVLNTFIFFESTENNLSYFCHNIWLHSTLLRIFN